MEILCSVTAGGHGKDGGDGSNCRWAARPILGFQGLSNQVYSEGIPLGPFAAVKSS